MPHSESKKIDSTLSPELEKHRTKLSPEIKRIQNFCISTTKGDFEVLEPDTKKLFLKYARIALKKGVDEKYKNIAEKVIKYSEKRIRIVSWNINGIRSNVLSSGKLAKCGWEKELDKNTDMGKLVKDYEPDIICLQETKCNDDVCKCIKIPNYYQYWSNSIKSGYSGTSVWTKIKPKSVSYNIPTLLTPDTDGRVIILEFDEFILINMYSPNSGTNFEYRTTVWDIAILQYLKELRDLGKNVIWCGDLNISPDHIDVHKGVTENVAGFTPEERKNFKDILKLGYVDTLRELNPDVKNLYSWWNMRVPIARNKNIGMRLDYFVTNNECMKCIENSEILIQYGGKTSEKSATSDHAPILLTLNINLL